MKKVFFYASLCLLLSACAGESQKSEKVEVNSIYQKHKVSSSGSGLSLVSEFHTNAKWDRLETEKFGDHIELSPPAQLTFNGKPFNKDNSVFTGAEYSLNISEFPEEMVWEWTDNNGKKYTNKAKMTPIKLKDKIFTPGRNQDLIIEWEGAPVQQDEKVMVTIEGDINGKSETDTKSTSTVGDTYISFGYEMIKQYDGNLSVEISRQGNIPVQEGTEAGGNIMWRYDGGKVTTTTKTLWDWLGW
ncbi:MAG: hypothetical protein K2X86_09675 [Cytophagaceae bacterium]|nr:hypothetical protein [Cytophagaceae bacterium]